ncbi:PRS29 protease, partial [Amia calva]|nr:PRS29 protease [Amia calva]
MPNTLQEVKLPILKNTRCQELYDGRFIIRKDMLCAGDEIGLRDTCQGDSGGPLVCKKKEKAGKEEKWVQAGIVSFGWGCALRQSPGVYTRVSSFIPWIKKHTGIKHL